MKALGITAMIVAIVAVFVPVLGPYVTILSAIMAAFAGGPGITFAVVALILNVVNIVFLSPSLWIAAGGQEILAPGSENAAIWAGKFLVGVQVVAAIVLAVVHSSSKKSAPNAVMVGQAADASSALLEGNRTGRILFIVVALLLVYGLFSGTDPKPDTDSQATAANEVTPTSDTATGTGGTTSSAAGSGTESNVAVEQRTSKWRVEIEKDAMEDTANVYLRLDAEEPIRLWPQTPTLVIRCHRNETDVIVVTGEPVRTSHEYGRSYARVRLRFDEDKPITSSWTESTSYTALFAPKPIALAKQLATTGEWLFEYQSTSSGTVMARFATAGLDASLPKVAEACHWK